MELKVIGIDCAVDAKNTGMAVGSWVGSNLTVEFAVGGSPDLEERVVEEVRESSLALLALDAPLGWPKALARELASHRAGQPIASLPNECFRRDTDHFVRHSIRKQPLDVGADRIARAAWAALTLLARIRHRTGLPIELAWQSDMHQAACIEVYPAATLVTRGLLPNGYKGDKPESQRRREAIVAALAAELTIPNAVAEVAVRNDHVLDAVICLLAAGDFLSGQCAPPMNLDVARQEGWIWFRTPGNQAGAPTRSCGHRDASPLGCRRSRS